MYRDKNGSFKADERDVIDRWKQHCIEYLNGAQTENQDSGRSGFIGVADQLQR